eukprot:116512-Rhodomonas_salina.3
MSVSCPPCEINSLRVGCMQSIQHAAKCRDVFSRTLSGHPRVQRGDHAHGARDPLALARRDRLPHRRTDERDC